ncbi:SDR family NAD(P)-dependent oxidoreductase, partial [Mycobacteroides abscessus]|nr:SDR family NAD(P)-dependent oxidoreductase [Mycobacteroides abscessus]
MFDLSARSVLVTGGTKGIGRGIATVFARAGANVAVAARSPRELSSVTAELGELGAGNVIGVRLDVSDPGS